MAFVGLWLICGLISAAIGSGKGEGCTGFLVGAVLGPFGILIAILSTGNRIPCPHCRELMHRDASVCPRCQR